MFSAGRFGKGIVLGALVVTLVMISGYAVGGTRVVTIAILPCKDVVMTFKKFHLLAGYLKQETGMGVKLVVPEDSATFEKDLRNRDIDFAFQDPYTYVRLSDLYNRNFLLKGLTREG